ncbi:hypothetical protein SAMN04488066_104125 [Halorubrum aquaticum]|uniref:Uncharacterized protein n=1 Tax=Halorubrum aquaticum TaxID=387340 RepID=A0A1I3A4H8_9EURY|nr:hypothetical protein SAMN04488066_104125 [Halorubrum aquaticum]
MAEKRLETRGPADCAVRREQDTPDLASRSLQRERVADSLGIGVTELGNLRLVTMAVKYHNSIEILFFR